MFFRKILTINITRNIIVLLNLMYFRTEKPLICCPIV